MTGRRTMTRIGGCAALVLMLVGGSMNAHAIMLGGSFCDQPQSIVGFGTPSQFKAHYEIFIPAYEARCSKAVGRITYLAGSDETTFQRALGRGPTNDQQDLFWARDTAFTEVEKQQIELDTQRLRGSYSALGHFPIYEQGLSVAYNLSCTSTPINFRAEVLSLIYLGVIDHWNDPRLVADNAQLGSCNKAIKLTARHDETGQTTYFKHYLALGNPAWAAFEQQQLNTTWPLTATISCQGIGESGEAGCVAANSGAIGYVTIPLAQSMGLRVGRVERVHADKTNPAKSGQDFVGPSLAGCTQAAASYPFPPSFDNFSDWSQVSLIGATDGYPICYFTYTMVFQKMLSAYSGLVSLGQAQTVRDYLSVIYNDAVQGVLTGKGYAPLPSGVLTMARASVQKIEWPDCPLPVRSPLYAGNDCRII
jgi:ABC-type phosphate transport system substrate-binding protein